MQTHRIPVVIPEDHRLVVEVPENIRSGPAEVILVIPESHVEPEPAQPNPEALARWDATVSALAKDRRPFQSLTPEEKRERHQQLRGIGKGILPSSEVIAHSKRVEALLEDAKFGR